MPQPEPSPESRRFNETGSVRSRKRRRPDNLLEFVYRFNEAGSVRSRKPPRGHPVSHRLLAASMRPAL